MENNRNQNINQHLTAWKLQKVEATVHGRGWICPSVYVIRRRRLHHPLRTYMLNSCSTNSRGDDQLFPEDGTGWLSVLLCVQHVLYDPTVYHKVRAVSLENSPLLSVGVSRFLTAKRLEPGWEVMKYLIPQRVCRRSQPLIAVPLLRAGVKGQLEMARSSSLK